MKRIIDFLKSCWFWFDGKKTVIGAFILLLVPFISNFNTTVLLDIWRVTLGLWFVKVLSTLTYIGNTLTGVGLLHKVTKVATDVIIEPVKVEEVKVV